MHVIRSSRAATETRPRRGHATYVFGLQAPVGDRWSRLSEGGTVTVFVKSGKELVPSPRCLNAIVSPDVYVPRLFGTFEARGAVFEVWEHVAGESAKFGRLQQATQIKLMRAIAGVNAVRCDDLPFKIRWLEHPLVWFEKRCRLHGGDGPGPWREAFERIAELDRARPEIRTSLSDEASGLSHNDLNPGNVIVGPTGDIRIVDWEKATRSVPGADLLFLVGLRGRRALLDVYMERTAELGLALDRRQVVHALEIIEGFRRIRAGCANGNLPAVRSGIVLAQRRLAADRRPPGRRRPVIAEKISRWLSYLGPADRPRDRSSEETSDDRNSDVRI